MNGGLQVTGLARVDVPDVELEVVFLVGAAVTVRAVVGLLPGVRSDVQAEVVTPLASPATEGTGEAVRAHTGEGVEGGGQECEVIGITGWGVVLVECPGQGKC